MSFDDDITAVFEDRAAAFTSHHRRMLRDLWERGRREGRGHEKAAFDRGRSSGLQELSVFFTKVLSRRKMDEVFYLRSSQLEYQPWALEVLQQVLDAPDLEEAERIASELGELETSELMRRAGTPAAGVEELERRASQGASMNEAEMLEGLWDRDGELERMRGANQVWEQRNKRRRR